MAKMNHGIKYYNDNGPSNIRLAIRCPECDTKRIVEPGESDPGCAACAAKAVKKTTKKAEKTDE